MSREHERRTPPALLHDAHALEAAGILDEVTGPAGILLWQAARAASLWVSAPAERRRELFRAAPPIPGEIDATVRDLVRELFELLPRPQEEGPDAVVALCRGIVGWATPRGHLATAIAFQQVAALARPDEPDLARRVGLLAAQRAEHGRAETWLRRALTIARRKTDWECYGLSLLGLGRSHRQRGSLPAAREHFLRAFHVGRRHRRRRVAALAAHDLFDVHLQMGQLEVGGTWAERASRLYRAGDAELIRFANDVAFAWMSRGEFRQALRVFRAVAPRVNTPALRLIALANVVRAAGGCGDRAALESAWSAAVGGFLLPGLEEVAADCWLDMARGAASLGDRTRAAHAAESACSLARRRGQNRVLFAAEAVMDAIRAESAAACEPAADSAFEGEVDPIATRVVRALAGAA